MTGALVLTALPLEARAIGRRLGLRRAAGREDHWEGAGLDVLTVGLGACRLEARTRDIDTPALVVAAGVCAALAPDLAPGDLVVPDTVITRAGDRRPTVSLPGLPRAGALLTVTAVVTSAAAKARLRSETDALAADMESAIILDWAAARGVPAAVVRAVSDGASDALPADLAAVVAADGRVRPLRAVRALLARPAALREALVLRRGTAAALDTVAGALARALGAPAVV